MLRGTAREAAAEFLGTAVLLAFGSAVVAQVVLSGQTHGGYLSINIAWGLAVTMGVYVAGGVSGAHLNPAVTLAVAVHRDFAWSKVLPYMAAQIAGAFTGAAVTFLTYRAAFDRFDGGTRQVTGAKATAGIFATYPQDFLRTFPDGLIDQVVGTALLIALIFALTDQKNLAPEGRIVPIHDVFRAGNHWWWVPIVGPLVGGVLGGAIYDQLIARHHPAETKAREAA